MTVKNEAAPWKVGDVAAEPVTVENSLVPVDDSSAVTIQGEEVIASPRVYGGEELLDSGDVMVPRLRLAQGLTAEVTSGDARPGQWVLTGFKPEEKVEVVVVRLAKLRQLRVGEDRVLQCQSGDAIHGVGIPGGDCGRCPYAQWGNEDGERKAPACNLIYSYMCYSLTHDTPVLVEFSRTSVQVALQLNQAIKSRRIGSFVATLTSKNEQKGTRKYSSPIFNARTITDEEQALVAEAGI